MADRGVVHRTQAQQELLDVWQRHTYAEFVTKNVEDALATMTEDAQVLIVPALTGGIGKAGVREFYANYFIPQVPPDLQVTTISQTVGEDRIVEEAVATFTHSLAMEWMLPGVAPSGKRLELAFLTINQFRDGLIAHEHLYWDQASMLVQLGLLDSAGLPIAGAETARLVRDPASFAAVLPRGHHR